jgi:hypothetical protein
MVDGLVVAGAALDRHRRHRAAVDQGRLDRATAKPERVAAELERRLRRDREFVERGFTVLDRCLAAGLQPTDPLGPVS